MVNAKKNEKQAELDKIYNEAKQKVTRETESAIAGARVCVAGCGCLAWLGSSCFL
jgi:hypothetical protein